jgi:uncharacterized protein (TIGR01319 family)
MPVIYAGNSHAAGMVGDVLREVCELSIVPNVRPSLEHEHLAPARDRIHDLFLEHVMAHAPGYDKLIAWADAPIMPTPGAVGDILRTIGERQRMNVVGVDIGGATTDVFSYFDGAFNRTVSANLGMSYSISNVCAEATLPNILRWVPYDCDARVLRNRVKNKMIRPTTIPQTQEALIFEQAVSREALRLAYLQHRQFAVGLAGVQKQRTVGDAFRQQASEESLIDNLQLDLLVASGGVLSHAPRMMQTAMLLIDAFEPEGVTRLAKDSIFMMPHLGVLASVHPRAAMEVFERDCLITLGTCIAPRGTAVPGQPLFHYRFLSGLNETGTLSAGELKRLELPAGSSTTIRIEPLRGFDVGNGPGQVLDAALQGGSAGVILDGRGRPLQLPHDRQSCQQTIRRWNELVGMYP